MLMSYCLPRCYNGLWLIVLFVFYQLVSQVVQEERRRQDRRLQAI